jgi:hypothetical protein
MIRRCMYHFFFHHFDIRVDRCHFALRFHSISMPLLKNKAPLSTVAIQVLCSIVEQVSGSFAKPSLLQCFTLCLLLDQRFGYKECLYPPIHPKPLSLSKTPLSSNFHFRCSRPHLNTFTQHNTTQYNTTQHKQLTGKLLSPTCHFQETGDSPRSSMRSPAAPVNTAS